MPRVVACFVIQAKYELAFENLITSCVCDRKCFLIKTKLDSQLISYNVEDQKTWKVEIENCTVNAATIF